MKTDDKCQECKKDWTKCGRCPVSMEWVKEMKVRIRNNKLSPMDQQTIDAFLKGASR